MRMGLDTSVMLRLLLGEPADQAARAVALLDELSRGGHQAVVSDLVVAEAYFALQHHYGVSKRNALLGLRRLFADGSGFCGYGITCIPHRPRAGRRRRGVCRLNGSSSA